jgi:hypothetical protein
LVYADDVNILDGSINTIEKNTETWVAVNSETGLQENADETKYIVMSRGTKTGRIRITEIDNSSFTRVEEFKWLGTTLTDQNYIQE